MMMFGNGGKGTGKKSTKDMVRQTKREVTRSQVCLLLFVCVLLFCCVLYVYVLCVFFCLTLQYECYMKLKF